MTQEEIDRLDDLTIIERINGEVTIDHYEQRMLTWRNVFDCKTGSNLSGAGQRAREAGYRFLCFEGAIYFVNHKGLIEDTGMTAAEIE